MTWLGIALAMFALSIAVVAWRFRRGRQDVTVLVPVDLGPRIETATRVLIDASPWQPASDPCAPEGAAAIEAALIANDRKRALDAAESMLAASPENPNARIWLAWALCANAQPTAALAELARVRDAISDAGAVRAATPAVTGVVGVAEPRAGDALAIYLRARAEHLQFEHAAGASDPVPALITTADLAVVTLASGRGAATWLRGTTETELSAMQARAAIGEHRAITARCLAGALDALDVAPGFADAAYLVARLAVKAGLLAPARVLFDALAGRMAGRPDAETFDRDRKDLANPAGAVAAAKSPPLPGKAKRSRSLKVLS